VSWSKRALDWVNDDTGEAFLSVVFTWHLPDAYSRAVWLRQLGYTVHAGGPAVALMPDYLADVAMCNGRDVPALERHNPNATFTSRGCIRRCPFCAVPRIEGDLRELDDWPVRPVICDNNLLACSRAHFDRVVDRLKPLSSIDFNQGLDARLLNKHHAARLAELDCTVRLAFDSVGHEPHFMRAFETLTRAGIAPDRIRVYVLFGFNDIPEDTLYRMRLIRSIGAWPNPQRYQPLDALVYNGYVGDNWTERELRRYMRYWARSMFFERMNVTGEQNRG
jgi:hypothetical protein